MKIWFSQPPGLLMQEIAFKSIKGRRIALRIQCFMPGQFEYLILSPSTTQQMECFSSHPKLIEKQSSQQASQSLCLWRTSRGRKPVFFWDRSQCVKAGSPIPTRLRGKSCSFGHNNGVVHLRSLEASQPHNYSERVNTKAEPRSSNYFCINRLWSVFPNHF